MDELSANIGVRYDFIRIGKDGPWVRKSVVSVIKLDSDTTLAVLIGSEWNYFSACDIIDGKKTYDKLVDYVVGANG